MVSRLSHLPWSDIIMALLLYAVVIVYQGYQYGQGDQAQIMPCLYAQDHPDTYRHDFYVTTYLDSPANERTLFHFFLRYLGYQYPLIVWIWHFAFSFALILGWLKIAALGIQHPVYRFLAVLLILVPGYHTSFGGNELYYNALIPSLVAKAVATWSVYLYLKERYAPWSYSLIIATLIQPLVGLQVFLVTGLALIIQQIRQKKTKHIPWKSMGLFLAVGLPWMLILSRYNGAHSDPATFMDIMEYRLSHHFFPSSFSWVDITLLVLMSLLAIRFYKQRLKWMMLLITLGCVVYTVGVETYRLPWMLYTQWCKSTIWLEGFVFLAIAVNLERWFPISGRWSGWVMIMPFMAFASVLGYRWKDLHSSPFPFMLPFSGQESDEVNISRLAGELTPADAVFIIPVEFTAFRWYSKRSLYVDYKSMLHQETYLQEWYSRMENIYAYSLTEKKAGFDLGTFSTTLLNEPSNISLQYWAGQGVTHFISSNQNLIGPEKLGSNERYAIYTMPASGF